MRAKFNVSRETMAKLEQYESLLIKWNRAINLVSPNTIPNLWSRHLLDSAQIVDFAPELTKNWVDFGSGGGFPGLVVSCLKPDTHVTCIESDVRKAAFLSTVIRELGLNANVISERIEEVDPLSADVISARAFAPVARLLGYAEPHLKKTGKVILLKGSKHLDEISEAEENWLFNFRIIPSITNQESAVLVLEEISRE